MSTTARAQQAPESYATFWEPLAGNRGPVPVAAATATDAPRPAGDAYLEFTEIAEGAPAARTARS